ncbi:FAD-dependent oxidoreductase [Cytobacillus suaedae]|nr:FAD-dependent oxidoreductase [Cytobacillus suaedae]
MEFMDDHHEKVLLQNKDKINNLSPTIAIVGGGLAGLTCAYRLALKGIKFTIFEGNNRLGGRCWTNREIFHNGQFVERGGELIDSKHSDILSLIKELGLEVDDIIASEKTNTSPIYYFKGENLYNPLQMKLQEVAQKLHTEYQLAEFPVLYRGYTKHALNLDQMSVYDWIQQNVEGGIESSIGQLLCVAYTIEHGTDCSQQSALNLVQFFAEEKNQQFSVLGNTDLRYRVSGGNDLIIKKLKEQLVHHIKHNYALQSIKKNANQTYSLNFINNGISKEIIVDKVVLAIPFSVIASSVDITNADFKPLKVAAIKELGMGRNSKIHFQFAQRLWEMYECNGTTYSNLPFQITSDSSRGQEGPGILVQISGGSRVENVGRMGKSAYSRKVLEELEQVFPGLQDTYIGKYCMDLWAEGKWARGSYSFRKVGQFTKFAGVEMEREGSCYFAGEHTSLQFQGYMNGAVESGNRVALEIVRDLTN